MTAWGEDELLVELLDRQFEFLKTGKGTQRIARLRRVLQFVEAEPQLSAILYEMRTEAEEVSAELDNADVAVRLALAELWNASGAEIKKLLAHITDEVLNVYGTLDGYATATQTRRALNLVRADHETDNLTKHLVRALEHWLNRIDDLAARAGQHPPEILDAARRQLPVISDMRIHLDRSIEEARCSLPWSAYQRLVVNRELLNPRLPDRDDPLGTLEFGSQSEFADILAQSEVAAISPSDGQDVGQVYAEIDDDSQLLHEELRFRIGQVRSRRALVRRYAARCEAFDAKRLRDLCTRDTRNAERLLTLDMARYLFDSGMSPLLDATVSGLRPDILHITPSSLFYTEAKQYFRKYSRAQIRSAIVQVWGTWGRLRHAHPSREAFLVIFRRSGPWLEVPPVVRHENLRLYIVVADLSQMAGSRDREQTICLTEKEILPQSLNDGP